MSPKHNTSGLMTNALAYFVKVTAGAILPLLMYKYGAYILGVSNVGSIEYSRSIINYFELFASFGINTFAIREGARIRNDNIQISDFSSRVFSINIVTASLSFLVLVLCTFIIPTFKNNQQMLIIFGIGMLLTAIGVEWLFNIYEQFIYITIRSLVFNFAAVVLMLLFVKKQAEIIEYVSFYVLGLYGSNILNLLISKKFTKIKMKFDKISFTYLKPMSFLFFNSLATTVYVNSDSTMLGYMVGNHSLGLYSVSVRVYNAFKLVVQSVLSISLPRLSYNVGKSDKINYYKLQGFIFRFITLIAIPCITIILIFRKDLIQLLSSPDFLSANKSLAILGIALLFSSFGMLTGSTILIPLRREKYIFLATSVGAITNIVLNLFLIPNLHEVGAAFTTAIAEMIVTIIEVYFARDVISITINTIKLDIKSILISILSCIILSLLLYNVFSMYLVRLIILGIIFLTLYFSLLYLFKNKIIIHIINMLKEKHRER